MAVFGILLALCLLMFMAYRGFSVIFFAPVFAILAALFSGMALLPTYTEIFLPALANYVKVFFPFFLLGAIFGKVMEESGAAKAIARAIVSKLGAKQAMLAVVRGSRLHLLRRQRGRRRRSVARTDVLLLPARPRSGGAPGPRALEP